MSSANATRMMAIMVKDPAPEVSSAAVAFATSLLWGGNSVVQDALVKHLEMDVSQSFIRTFAEKVRCAVGNLGNWKCEFAFMMDMNPSMTTPSGSRKVRVAQCCAVCVAFGTPLWVNRSLTCAGPFVFLVVFANGTGTPHRYSILLLHTATLYCYFHYSIPLLHTVTP